VAEQTKARVCGPPLAGVVGSNPAKGTDICVVCCRIRNKGKSQDNEDTELRIK
jgi:hypothetical protein